MKQKGFVNRRDVLNRIVRRNREFIVCAKAKPCTDCGIQYNSWVMQFDHRIPEQKAFELHNFRKCSIETLRQEIAKCDVVR